MNHFQRQQINQEKRKKNWTHIPYMEALEHRIVALTRLWCYLLDCRLFIVQQNWPRLLLLLCFSIFHQFFMKNIHILLAVRSNLNCSVKISTDRIVQIQNGGYQTVSVVAKAWWFVERAIHLFGIPTNASFPILKRAELMHVVRFLLLTYSLDRK